MIPVNEPALGERELEYVTECIRTGSDRIGVLNAIAVFVAVTDFAARHQ